MRLLVTGSRDWSDQDAIAQSLDAAWQAHGSPAEVTLVHGACPTGADAMAAAEADRRGWFVEAHPADWSAGRRAGPQRNASMVALGATACCAFIGPCTSPRCRVGGTHPSHGPSGCADLAEKAGIPTYRWSDFVEPGTVPGCYICRPGVPGVAEEGCRDCEREFWMWVARGGS